MPTVALPSATPLTDQVTVMLEVPLTAAVNCSAGSPGRTFDAAGLTDTLGVEEAEPPDPARAQPLPRDAREITTKQSAQFKRRVDTKSPHSALSLGAISPNG